MRHETCNWPPLKFSRRQENPMSKKATKNPKGVTELTGEELDGVAAGGEGGSGGIRSTGGGD